MKPTKTRSQKSVKAPASNTPSESRQNGTTKSNVTRLTTQRPTPDSGAARTRLKVKSAAPPVEIHSKPSAQTPMAALRIPPILLQGDEPEVSPETGPGRKFLLGPAPPSAAAEIEPRKLPEAYGTGRLLLTARDPHCLYAHWDLTSDQQRHYNNLSAHHHLVVRIYLQNLSGQLATELHVHPESRHWFIHVDQPGQQYLAELGYYPPNKPWRIIAASEPAITPPEAVAEESPVQFATFTLPPAPPPQPDPTTAVLRLTEPGAMPAQAIPPAAPARTPSRTQWSAPQPGWNPDTAPNWLPASEELPAHLARAELPFGVAVSASPAMDATGESTWTSTQASSPAPEWSATQERALAELIGWSSVRQEVLGSAEIEELVRGEARRDVAPGREVSSIQGAGFSVPLPVSSAAIGELPFIGQPSFWFNVNAELVIYGATEPDARVTIGGRPICLRPDGTFSYRFALPDGSYQLPIAAASAHGDMRQAELDFSRSTRYTGEVDLHPQDPALKAPLVENVS